MYKTILVYIDGGPHQSSRLRAAAMLADAHGAHLVGSAATGISWMDFALLTGSAGAPIPADDFTALRESAAERLRAFTVQAAALGVASYEARPVEDIADYALLMQSRYADLIVLSQDDDASPRAGLGARVRGLPERVALHGVRPVLLVPGAWQGAVLPGTAVVGWDGGMCALRAMQAALPLLQAADGVKLALVNPNELSELHGEEPGADMALYLARHGVKVEVVVERTRATVGDALAGIARNCGAGLMVSGAYGHSRLREWVLGGATRELLERAPAPLLLAH
ncbi:universal stress protein [Massilia sp. 9096]|uniref:universal stress protein n=1 Tax=Massilia sp. 9096 TaxID=1500894 RepID=UPI00055B76A7|nr:universal stress protein [Massilia sp. 9096]